MRSTTYDTAAEVRPKAVLVSLVTDEVKRSGIDPVYSLEELMALAETAGVEVLSTVSQNRETKDTKWFIGKGKVQELKVVADELGANTAIFDQELSGAQVRNLEEELDLKIIDRTQLILDIFAQRAKTREGIIQVELAQLSYLLPRLAGQGGNLSRLGGGIGARGPGETKLETDRRHIRGRIDELRRQIGEVERHRTLQRQRRKKSGTVQVALVGYTNAGKSTLLRQLTDADVYVENQLFATLDPTSRMLELPGGREVVLTDTVGFIQNLPHHLIAAFRATLEEVNEADLVLHVIDASSDMLGDHIKVVDGILEELGSAGTSQIRIYNKKDLCTPEQLELLPEDEHNLRLSAYNESDLERLLNRLQEELTGGTVTYRIPAARGDLSAQLYKIGEVVSQEFEEEDVVYEVRLHTGEAEKYTYLLEDYKVDRS
ncbi:GTPase HflX [Saccharibacillus sp. CPCC 101409]|uniref:GTPase HflX n=1 Tax=Saccharibacillus sp. CPCC 101409 TaxID=3058041 RepID=UPI0026734BF6|nr:GTPase HflX [Saccharibacillus sp. CPCC 101409]MDO3412821.1 GTPase HflX [Saccharibacillus sp. CPCC 101409]